MYVDLPDIVHIIKLIDLYTVFRGVLQFPNETFILEPLKEVPVGNEVSLKTARSFTFRLSGQQYNFMYNMCICMLVHVCCSFVQVNTKC